MERKLQNPLTEEQRRDLEEKLSGLQSWEAEQRKIIEKEAVKSGKWKDYGLDSNQHLFSELIRERNKKFRELQIEYGFNTTD